MKTERSKKHFLELGGKIYDAIRLMESASSFKTEELSRFALKTSVHSLRTVLEELNDLGRGIHFLQEPEEL
jgi:hypothetical protein